MLLMSEAPMYCGVSHGRDTWLFYCAIFHKNEFSRVKWGRRGAKYCSTEMYSGSKEGAYVRLGDFCITQC